MTVPVPNMKRCYRCGLDYPPVFQHPAEECSNRRAEREWPPSTLETKEMTELRDTLKAIPVEDRKKLLEGKWTDED